MHLSKLQRTIEYVYPSWIKNNISEFAVDLGELISLTLGLSLSYCCHFPTRPQYDASIVEVEHCLPTKTTISIDPYPCNMASTELPSEKEKMLRGELYYAFTPDLIAARTRCKHACQRFNNAGDVSRRRQIELWKE